MTTMEPQSTPGMSYLAEDDVEWEVQTPASRRKVLRLDDDLYVAIVQWNAGFELPGLDEHGGEEIVYVLEGTSSTNIAVPGPAPSSAVKRAVPTGPAPRTASPSWSCARWPPASVIA